jgi:hypothetical protein
MPESSTAAFGPETIAVMRSALEQAWSSLTPEQQACTEQSTLALEIINLARQGENDPKRLCAHALTSISPRPAPCQLKVRSSRTSRC